MKKLLCLIAIFKNESHILKEWIEHYIKEGVEKFFLIDNGSTDNYKSIINEYINSGIIELVIDETRYAQNDLYNKYFLTKCKEYTWALICDLDEFVYARKQFNTIKEYLISLNNEIDQILIPWKMFGSSGYNTMQHKQPEKVIPNFLYRRKAKGKIEIKSITRTNNLLKIHQHRCHLLNKKMKREDFFAEINEEKLKSNYIHLNHYPIQSLEWFLRVKATRGDVATVKSEQNRDKRYFHYYDINDIKDCELFVKQYKTTPVYIY
jgi:hypothetical protein